MASCLRAHRLSTRIRTVLSPSMVLHNNMQILRLLSGRATTQGITTTTAILSSTRRTRQPQAIRGELKETRALDQRSTATHKSEAPAGLVTRQEVPQPQTTGNGSHRGSPDLAKHRSAPPAPKEAEPRTEEPGDDGAWPSSLRRYLQRAFDKCDKKHGSRQHAQLEKALHRKVTDAMAENAMLTKDWDNEPLPSLVASKRERSPSRGEGRNRQGEKNKKRNHGQIEARAAATPRKGKGSLSKMPQADQRRLSNRFERFDLGMRPPPSSSSRSGNDLAFQSKPMVDDNGMVDWAAITIKGTSTKLEKDYLRLTQPPDPASVRPQYILEKSLENISAKWAKGGLDYIYACSQLKAIRQDCVVQRIKNAFTVQVYEGHARIALQQGDLNEYNQCQTQLQELYACGLEGSQEEFTAYRVLYYLYLQTSCSGGSTGLQKILQELPAGEQAPAINHALRVRKAVAMTDYHLFFSLYKTTPNLGQHIMQKLLKTMRVEALRRIIKAYRPTISLSFVLGELIFDRDEDGVAFLQACGVIFTPNGAEVACKESSVDASGLDADAPNSLL
ncbi:unnamed protein product [Ectocarpus sp. 12 AP-2014]